MQPTYRTHPRPATSPAGGGWRVSCHDGPAPSKDIATLTVIQGPAGRADGAKPQVSYIIGGKFAAARLVASIKKHLGERYTSESYQGHTIHVIPAADAAPPATVKPDDGPPGITLSLIPATDAYIVVSRDDLIVAATSATQLKQTLDVIDGRAAGLTAEQAAAFLPARQDGAYVSVAATETGLAAFTTMLVVAEGEPPAGVRGISQIAFTVGEAGGDVIMAGRARTKDAEAAANLKAVVDGMRALMALSTPAPAAAGAAEDKNAAAFVEALAKAQISVDKETVAMSLRMPAETFLSLIHFAKPDQPAGVTQDGK